MKFSMKDFFSKCDQIRSVAKSLIIDVWHDPTYDFVVYEIYNS